VNLDTHAGIGTGHRVNFDTQTGKQQSYEEHIAMYLQQYVGEMKVDEVKLL